LSSGETLSYYDGHTRFGTGTPRRIYVLSGKNEPDSTPQVHPSEDGFEALSNLCVDIHHEQLPVISSNHRKQGLRSAVGSSNVAGGCGPSVGYSWRGIACVC
jgi:hypothetical protein